MPLTGVTKKKAHMKRRMKTVMMSPLMTNKDTLFMNDFKIDSAAFLDEITDRTVCPVCEKSRMFFCYTCYVPVREIENLIPKLELPLEVDIIKHPHESEGKSTACHAAILAPKHVKIHIFPDIPDYSNKNVLLVFPSKSSISLEEGLKLFPSPDGSSSISSANLHKIVFIDSTWKQTKRLYGDERLNRLPCVEIKSRNSLFWRYQRGSPLTHLATVEAIYYFLRDFHVLTSGVDYDGRFDNVLFFFKFMFDKIYRRYHNVDEIS